MASNIAGTSGKGIFLRVELQGEILGLATAVGSVVLEVPADALLVVARRGGFARRY